jgi:hypothetical protein
MPEKISGLYHLKSLTVNGSAIMPPTDVESCTFTVQWAHEPCRFWMVARGDGVKSEGRPPEVRHATASAAHAEARRLAAKEAGSSFTVLEAIAYYRAPQPEAECREWNKPEPKAVEKKPAKKRAKR